MEPSNPQQQVRNLAWRVVRSGCITAVVFAFATFLHAQNSPASKAPAQEPSAAASSTASPKAHKRPQLSNEKMADLHMARKEYADAVDFYLRALRDVSEKRAELWNKIGIAYQQQQDYLHARKAYQRSLKLDKTLAPAWNNLGTSYFLVNNAKKSVKYYRKAIQLSPDTAAFHLNLGTAYYHLKKVPESIEQYRSALTLNPDILAQSSRTASVVETRTADAKFFFYLAKIFASLGRPNEALRYLSRAMEQGFQDKERIENDPDLKKLSKLPAFINLMKHPPTPIK